MTPKVADFEIFLDSSPSYGDHRVSAWIKPQLSKPQPAPIMLQKVFRFFALRIS